MLEMLDILKSLQPLTEKPMRGRPACRRGESVKQTATSWGGLDLASRDLLLTHPEQCSAGEVVLSGCFQASRSTSWAALVPRHIAELKYRDCWGL